MRAPKHFGFAVCEHNAAIVPLESFYSSLRHARANAADQVARVAGLEATAVHLWPASQHEAAREAVELAASDSAGFVVLPTVQLRPHAAREAVAPDDAPETLEGLDASQAIALLAYWGYSARYSRGGNVWACAPRDALRLEAAGMRWSARRGMWWIHTTEPGEALAEDCKREAFAAA